MSSRRKLVLASLLCALLLAAALVSYVLIPPRTEPLSFVERLSKGARADQPLPLLIAIHGRGDSPEQFAAVLENLQVPARIVLPRGPEPYDHGRQWYSLEHALRWPATIRARTTQLAELAQRVQSERPTLGRPVVTGFSQGGVLSFALAAFYPSAVSASVPIAAAWHRWLPGPHAAARMPSLHAYHGEADPVMPLDGARAMVSMMREAGAQASLVQYRDVGHQLSDTMRSEVLHRLEQLLGEAARDTRTAHAAPARR
jgi:phospholipase/carboxylesterase